MFFNPKVSVTYNVRLKRARAQFRVGECHRSRRPPADALDKAREKLEEELEDGHIEYFEVFEKKFHSLWNHVRDHADSLPAEKEVRFTLAQGARAYSEVMVQRSRDPAQLALLTCRLSERKAKALFFSAFVFHIVRQLQELGIHEKVDGAQLRFIYLLMKAGQQIEHWPLNAAPLAALYPKQKLLVEKDASHHYVALHIFDARLLQDETKCEKIYLHALNSFKDDASSLTWLKDHTIEKLRSLNNKVQSLGFSLPYSLLIAYDSQYRLNAPDLHEEKPLPPESSSEELPRWKVRVGALMRRQKSDYIELGVDDERMTAVVKQIHPKALASLKEISSDWLLHECHKQGVVFGYEKFLDPVVEALKAGTNPVGMRMAEGEPAKSGSRMYLHLSYRDPPVVREGQSDDIRERQNTRLARAGQPIAEVRYDDGIPGRNVFGEDIHVIGSALEARITADESVQLQGRGQFVALRDGLIEADAHNLRIVPTYVHKGSVNLSSGNLAFDGAVVVQGDIEAGATVEVKGTLLVEGVISHATVKVGGDLEVTGGMITTPTGLVVVGGSCFAQFIENSRLHVKGRLEVQKSILNSQVVCGGPLLVRDPARGVISGGAISCWSAMAVRHLGLAQGNPTVCRIGTHYATEIRWQRMSQRWRLLHDFCEGLGKQLKDVPTHAQGRKGTENEAHRQALQQRLQKAEKALAHIQKRRDLLEKQMKWNPNATLVVRGILDRQVEIEAAGKKTKTSQNLQGVLITASAWRGSFIHDLSIWDEFHKAWPDARLADVS